MVIMVVVFICGMATLFFLNRPTKTNDAAIDPESTGLIITNANQYTDKLDGLSLASIQGETYRRLVTYGQEGTYQGTIRPGSFHVTYSTYQSAQIPQYEFLIDIPTAKQSYSVSYSGGPQYPYNILYVLCPSANQLRYGDFGCKDEL
jgi:hypothetical protein